MESIASKRQKTFLFLVWILNPKRKRQKEEKSERILNKLSESWCPMEIIRNWAERTKSEQREREPVFIFCSVWWLHSQMCINNQNEEKKKRWTKNKNREEAPTAKAKKEFKIHLFYNVINWFSWCWCGISGKKKLIKSSAENIYISNYSCIDDVKSFELNINSWISFIIQPSYKVQSICNIWCSSSPSDRANDLNWIPLARGSNRLECSGWIHWIVCNVNKHEYRFIDRKLSSNGNYNLNMYFDVYDTGFHRDILVLFGNILSEYIW